MSQLIALSFLLLISGCACKLCGDSKKDVALIQEKLFSRQNEINLCLQEHSSEQQKEIILTLFITINGKGNVLEVKITGEKLNNQLTNCLQKEINQIKFPAHKNQLDTKIKQQMRFILNPQ